MARKRAVRPVAAFTVTTPQGAKLIMTKAKCSVGTQPTCDIVISGANAAASHAVLEAKGKQVLCRALLGESMFDDSFTWQDGVQLRPNVGYVLGSGARLAFGSPDQQYVIEFEEGSGSNPLVEMLMQGMLSKSSQDVKQALGKQ